MTYINTYEVTREFAGAEEGGRYGTVRTPIASVRIRGGVNSRKALTAYNRYLKAQFGRLDTGYYSLRRPGYYRDSGQIDHTVCLIEAAPARYAETGFGRYE